MSLAPSTNIGCIIARWPTGIGKLAKKERAESIEEMQHADKLVDRILFLEGHPNLQQVRPLMIGENLKEVLECDLKGEQIAREYYAKSREICREVSNYVTMQLFEELLKDEEGRIDFLRRSWICWGVLVWRIMASSMPTETKPKGIDCCAQPDPSRPIAWSIHW